METARFVKISANLYQTACCLSQTTFFSPCDDYPSLSWRHQAALKFWYSMLWRRILEYHNFIFTAA